MQFERFTPLSRLSIVAHAFTLRTAEDTKSSGYEERVIDSLGFSSKSFASAEQPHGAEVATITAPGRQRIERVDALITATRDLPLLVRCADCAAIFIVDPIRPAIGLIHSGKRGTQANIVSRTVARMQADLATNPADCLALISPSIGPCHYEMDLWETIELQLQKSGIPEIHNPRVCTACHLDRYFSYRAEKGHTGRMFAVLMLNPTCLNALP